MTPPPAISQVWSYQLHIQRAMIVMDVMDGSSTQGHGWLVARTEAHVNEGPDLQGWQCLLAPSLTVMSKTQTRIPSRYNHVLQTPTRTNVLLSRQNVLPQYNNVLPQCI